MNMNQSVCFAGFVVAAVAALVADGATAPSCIIEGSTNRIPASAEDRSLSGRFDSRWFDYETAWLTENFRIRFSGLTLTFR